MTYAAPLIQAFIDMANALEGGAAFVVWTMAYIVMIGAALLILRTVVFGALALAMWHDALKERAAKAHLRR